MQPIERMGHHMATGFASALSEGQPAQLDLGEEAVPCLVVGFQGSDVMLAPGAALPEDAIGQTRTTAYLLIEAGGALHALKAEVRPGYAEGELVATLLDPFRLGQRRNFSRAPIVLPGPPAPDRATTTSRGRRSPATSAPAACAWPSSRPTARPASTRSCSGLVQADREIRAAAAEVRVTPPTCLSASRTSKPRTGCCSRSSRSRTTAAAPRNRRPSSCDKVRPTRLGGDAWLVPSRSQ